MKTMGEFGKDKIYQLLDESKRVCKKMRGYYFCNESALQYYLSWATENNCNFNIIVLSKRTTANLQFCSKKIAVTLSSRYATAIIIR